MRVVAILAISVLWSCASTREVKNVDTEILAKSRASDGVIGLNGKNEAVIQKKTDAGVELTVLEHVNENLQANLNSERFTLNECRKDMARLNGTNELAPIPEVDNLKAGNKVREELGLDSDGKLVVVKKQSLEERLTAERAYEESLRSTTKVVKKNREECEFKLEIARNKKPSRLTDNGN